MVKIGLFCAAGFSTGMLVNNIELAAEEQGLSITIEAHGQPKLKDLVTHYDVVLLGPQIAYTFSQSEAICKEHHVPIAVIPMSDYGMLDGHKVLNLAMKLYQDSQVAEGA
ncbi:PTS sugar transporter subunit IIB [Streptococcus merionis]|uniref:PTS system, cellobiose-specific IIB component n=1 Tax=Streptococcus merionis TaxID=400065 RepID=A0A239SLS1_9STRE|nr:PTS sugar transporter subunit IIB [Streptococcus merionis]SNU86371.1 PTS system, cellobiose-specific IIB component [Streptococcus merionis]